MKLKTTIQPKYQEGATRSILRFAWLPHRIGDKKVWLERYEVLYVWCVEKVKGEIEGKAVEFIVGNWKKVSEATL